MKTLIIGKGQVGSSLYLIVGKAHETFIKDVEPLPLEGVEVLHICYPDSPRFVEITKAYIREYKPTLTIINSSVAVGTTDKCGPHVVNSPVRGRHPNLETEMLHYPKFIAGREPEAVMMAAAYFKQCGWEWLGFSDPRATEFVKLISNVHMGLEVAWRQEVERMLKEFNIDPRIYEAWEKTYNDGYRIAGHHQLIRPLMRPDPIGGHCILPCTEILKDQFPSKALDFILDSNERRKSE